MVFLTMPVLKLVSITLHRWDNAIAKLICFIFSVNKGSHLWCCHRSYCCSDIRTCWTVCFYQVKYIGLVSFLPYQVTHIGIHMSYMTGACKACTNDIYIVIPFLSLKISPMDELKIIITHELENVIKYHSHSTLTHEPLSV